MDAFYALTNQLQTTFKDCVSVQAPTNPVLKNLRTLNGIAALQQYSILPGAFVDFLEIAQRQAALKGWKLAVEALTCNLAEEKGSKTGGISHADLLAEGLEQCLHVTVKGTVSSPATRALSQALDEIAGQSIAYIFGSAYAIEATAAPELTIVSQIIEMVLEGEMPRRLKHFFEMHLNEWEPEHEATLRESIAPYLKAEEFETFENGFWHMVNTLDCWWVELAAEVQMVAAVGSVR
ncbi:DUF3865 domain-containing protein [Phormidium tenue FACHB-886]|nr:DUF3865 domain-containing protein [Phormidium tenue FACHB-886]